MNSIRQSTSQADCKLDKKKERKENLGTKAATFVRFCRRVHSFSVKNFANNEHF